MFAEFRKKIAAKTRGFMAPEHNIRCIEAAVANAPNFDAGFAIEQQLFGEVMRSTQAKAQQYYFFAEREAAKIPDIPRDTNQIPIATAGVLGAGTMGGGIAMNFANAGIPVVIVERDQESLDRGLAVIRKNYERSASRGSISSDDVGTRMALIQGSTDKGDFHDRDIVIEAVFEDMELKKTVFAELDSICKPGAIMASNTSALDVNVIAASTTRPESVIGMHFFSPANVMKLLEVVRGSKTSPEVVATTMALAKRINKIAALVGVCHGFVGNRMLFMRGIEAQKMLLEGATPAQIDRVIYDFGFPMGPFAMSDLAGLDIGWKAETSTSSTVRELLCESGRRGQKNGRGYYTYDPDTRASTPDPEVEAMIADFGRRQGVTQREVSDQEILERCLYPMVNEGAKILDEGIAIRASDIDVVWINGYGWPVYTGGPMFWADQIGLVEVAARIEHYASTEGGDHWKISPLLARLAVREQQLRRCLPPLGLRQVPAAAGSAASEGFEELFRQRFVHLVGRLRAGFADLLHDASTAGDLHRVQAVQQRGPGGLGRLVAQGGQALDQVGLGDRSRRGLGDDPQRLLGQLGGLVDEVGRAQAVRPRGRHPIDASQRRTFCTISSWVSPSKDKVGMPGP